MYAKKTFCNLASEKQRKIIDVAIKEFSSRGYRNASINTMIANLGISKGSIYQYFDNKESLFLFIFHYCIELVKENILLAETTLWPNQNVFTKIKIFFSSSIEFAGNHPLIFRLYLRTLFESDIPFKRDLIKKVRKTSVEYLIPILEEGRKKGEIRANCDTKLIANILDAIIDRFLQNYLGSDMDSDGWTTYLENDVNEWIEILKKGIV